jgi:hypothetical protein
VKFLKTKVWNFDSLRQAYTKMEGTKFNGYILSLLSIALKKQMDKNGCKIDKILTAQPVNMRSPPKGLDDVKIANLFGYSKFEFPLINDMTETPIMLKSIRNAFDIKQIQASMNLLKLI